MSAAAGSHPGPPSVAAPTDLELRPILKGTVLAVCMVLVLVALGDYYSAADFAGPEPRVDDGSSISLNVAASLKAAWLWLGQGARGIQDL